MTTTQTQIQDLMRELSAADAADLFMSPFVHAPLLLEATKEEGPAMWMVNRSDILSPVLEILAKHSLEGISDRADQKLKARKNPPVDLPEALDPEDIDLENIPHHEVEEILGHPQVPLRQISRLIQSKNADHKVSSALSFARRVLEFPPSIDEEKELQELNKYVEYLLNNESSDLVRSYLARIPTLSQKSIATAIERESNPQVLARLLQHPSLEYPQLLSSLSKSSPSADPLVETVLSLDSRMSKPEREKRLSSPNTPHLAYLFHKFVLNCA